MDFILGGVIGLVLLPFLLPLFNRIVDRMVGK